MLLKLVSDVQQTVAGLSKQSQNKQEVQQHTAGFTSVSARMDGAESQKLCAG